MANGTVMCNKFLELGRCSWNWKDFQNQVNGNLNMNISLDKNMGLFVNYLFVLLLHFVICQWRNDSKI